jgi:glycosyltransferase involved in cell wall biosynthesis
MAMVRAQLTQHHDVTVVSTYGAAFRPDEAAEQLRRLGAAVRLIGPVHGPTAWHWQIGRALREAIRGASIVHVHGLWEEIQHKAARVARRLGVPYLITPHGMLDPWSLRQRSLKKRLYLRLRLRRNLEGAAAIHFTTTTERDGVGALGLQSAATIVEPYSIDFSEFEELPARGWLRAKFPQIGNRKILLFFSRLHYKKGLELLIPAFAQAKRDDAVLVLAGPVEPEYEHQIDDLILVHGVRDRVFKTACFEAATAWPRSPTPTCSSCPATRRTSASRWSSRWRRPRRSSSATRCTSTIA